VEEAEVIVGVARAGALEGAMEEVHRIIVTPQEETVPLVIIHPIRRDTIMMTIATDTSVISSMVHVMFHMILVTTVVKLMLNQLHQGAALTILFLRLLKEMLFLWWQQPFSRKLLLLLLLLVLLRYKMIRT